MRETTVTHDRITFCVEYELVKGEKPDYGDGGHAGSDSVVWAHAIWLQSDAAKTDISELLSVSAKEEIENKILESFND